MRILVTGGAGFIASHIVDACLAQGHDVAVVDDFSSGSAANLAPRARLYCMDIRSRELAAVFAAERPEVVSHHAAQVSVRRSVEEPVLDAGRARRVMGWEPRVDLEDGLRRTWAWFLSHAGRERAAA